MPPFCSGICTSPVDSSSTSVLNGVRSELLGGLLRLPPDTLSAIERPAAIGFVSFEEEDEAEEEEEEDEVGEDGKASMADDDDDDEDDEDDDDEVSMAMFAPQY